MERRDFSPTVGEDGSTRVPSRATIWIVEDSPLQLNEMRRLLAADYDVGAFDSAEEMLERLGQGAPPDVLLLDSQLDGGISGLEACRFVRSKFDEVTLPILLVTAFQAAQDLTDGLDAGANDFLRKPYVDAELRARVRTLARVRQLAQSAEMRAAWFATTLSSLGDAVLTTDKDGRVTFLNPAAAALTGWHPAEAVGHLSTEVVRIFLETTREPVPGPVEEVLRRGAPVALTNQTMLVRKDGQKVPIDHRAAPLRDGAGQAVGVVLVVRDHTESRRTARELLTFRSLIENSGDFIGFSGPDGRVQYLNPAGRALIGLQSLEEATALNAADVFTPETSAASMAEMFPMMREGHYFRGETLFRHMQTGEVIPMQQDTFGIRGEGGQIEVAATISRDLRARKAAEAKSEQLGREVATTRARLAAVFQNAPAFVCTLRGPELIFELANGPYLRHVGKGRPLVGRAVQEALPELAGQGFFEILDGVFQTGTPFFGSEVLVRLDREGDGRLEDAYVNFVYQPSRDAHGDIEGIDVFGFEVTEQVRARQQVEALDERQRRLLDAAGAGLWDLDATTGVIDGDARIVELMGMPPGTDLSHEAGWSAMHPDDRERVNQVISAAIAGANAGRYRVEFRTGGQGGAPERWVESRAQVAFDEQGRAVRIAGVMVDVTERKLAETAAQRQSEFEQQLIGIVSHDLRNPLNVVALATSGILRREDLDERVLKAGLRIHAAAQRAITMIGDLLDFTQARLGGGIPIHPRSCDLHAVAQGVAAEVEVIHPEREILLTQTGDGHGFWDPDRLGQVVQNLLTNALKYSPGGTRVTVATSAADASVELSVHNAGPALPEALQTNLFEPFKRGSAVLDAHSRSIGLGLYIVKQVVEAHAGTVDVRSVEGEGTTFRVRLPRDIAHVPAPRASVRDVS